MKSGFVKVSWLKTCKVVGSLLKDIEQDGVLLFDLAKVECRC